MSFDEDDEFKDKMKDYINGSSIGGRDTDLLQIIYTLNYQVKEFFPMNGIPQSVVDSLDILKHRFILAEACLKHTLELIIYEVEKLDKLNGDK